MKSYIIICFLTGFYNQSFLEFKRNGFENSLKLNSVSFNDRKEPLIESKSSDINKKSDISELYELKLDTISFLLGMTRDYFGHRFMKNHPVESSILTFFYSGEIEKSQLFLKYLKLYNSNKYAIIVRQKSKDDFIKIYSNHYNAIFKTYYRFKYHKDDIFYDEDNQEFQIAAGKFRKCKLNSLDKRLSFILGVFQTNGKVLDEFNYEINVTSVLIYKDLLHLIKKSNMKISNNEIIEGRTPTSQKIVFKPSIEFKVLLDSII